MIRFLSFGFTYPGAERPALGQVRGRLPGGSVTLLRGRSGSGKSTLLRALIGLVPHYSGGRVVGQLQVAGLDPVAEGPERMSLVVGWVGGDPESGFVTDTVFDEVAFALEQRGATPQEIVRRVGRALEQVGLGEMAHRTLDSLSAGEKQRTAIAAVLALEPRVLLLDEPTSQLDDSAAEAVLDAVSELASHGARTVVISEHRLWRIRPHASHELLLDGLGCGAQLVAPPSPAEKPPPVPPRACRPGSVVLRMQEVSFGYDGQPVLTEISLALRSGEVVLLGGPSGSGKTTLLRLATGLLQPQAGAIEVLGQPASRLPAATLFRQVGYLPQDPGALLFADSVYAEVAATLTRRAGAENAIAKIWPLLESLGLADVAHCYPRDLSTGQRQRVALAAVVIAEPPVLLLDEPTRGLDDQAIRSLGHLLHEFANRGAAILVASHDRRLSSWADRRLQLAEGRLQEGDEKQSAAQPAASPPPAGLRQ